MDAIEEEKVLSYEETKRKIEAMLYYKKSREKFNEWVKRLRDDAYISIR